MNGLTVLLSPPVAFVIFLALALGLYGLGGRLGPKLSKSAGKLTTYACGENIPGAKVQFGYRLFFFVALFFTMMHVAALVIATIPGGRVALLAVFYLIMILLSILALVTRS